MKCNEILKEIIPFYSGELNSDKEKEYMRHTTVCKECARVSFKIRKAKKYLERNI